MFVKHAFIIALAIIPSILALPVPDARTTSLQPIDAAEKWKAEENLTREEMKLTEGEGGVKPANPKLTRRSPTPGGNQSHDSRPSHLHWPTRPP
ncbi:hypothetical protein FRC14_002667 [Serendipita sp. 396]|nr:hypothetical protein FRC14_002667 [Serendipita sp. 396]KAG8783747.1 hypothetical protein FRC15_004606 [Serendipita sp. 397]KAG8871723.1 hypothetical protein FRC20_010251 [Serendipita sp. 405]